MNIELLREYCLSLPGVTEDVKWGNDLCFCIYERMFCITGLNNEPLMVTLKVKDEEFEELIASFRPLCRTVQMDFGARCKTVYDEGMETLYQAILRAHQQEKAG
jgi:hypothetical protein